jgi:hypothetical protein
LCKARKDSFVNTPVPQEEAQALDRLALLILQSSLAGTFGGVAIAAGVHMEVFYRWLFVAGAQFLVLPALFAILALSPWEAPADDAVQQKRTLVVYGLVSLYAVFYAATLAGAARAIIRA